MRYYGLGKTLYNSSACLISKTKEILNIEIALTERLTRKKGSGAWPEKSIASLSTNDSDTTFAVAENRDVSHPWKHEDALDLSFPFFEHIKRLEMSHFVHKLNPSLDFISHHYAHAMAAVAVSPFNQCLIVVMDGAGSAFSDVLLPSTYYNLGSETGPGAHEELSVFTFDEGAINCVAKRWRRFQKSQSVSKKTFSEGAGIFYESAAEYVFNSNRSAGKVMGLAPFGESTKIDSRVDFLDKLDWSKAFSEKGKTAWETSGNFKFYADISASVQLSFEEEYLQTLEKIRTLFPGYDKIIITGGCALNCTANAKLLKMNLFSEIYIPPFPGDECIALGCASYLYHEKFSNKWKPIAHEHQTSSYGPMKSSPEEEKILTVFKDFRIQKLNHSPLVIAQDLSAGKIIGWFQGRSETGPRSLGHRSILADPRPKGLKKKINNTIKFREDFRPYGCSCLHELAHELFDVPVGFNNPFMSFAVHTRPAYQDQLHEVTHVDGTSRMQTVRRSQNEPFYDLIQAFGKLTGLPCLLNTSLNVMGEPIVESIEDALHFFINTPVDSMVIGDFYVQR